MWVSGELNETSNQLELWDVNRNLLGTLNVGDTVTIWDGAGELTGSIERTQTGLQALVIHEQTGHRIINVPSLPYGLIVKHT